MELSGFDKLLRESLSVSQRKQQELEETSQRMQNKFNPLNYDNVEHVDGDTFRLKDNPEVKFRVQNDPSYGVDTYESDRRVYENDPQRLASHRRNYSKLTGRPEWSITINELVERGQIQSEQTRARMSELGKQGRLGYKTTGVDDYGRNLVQLYDTETGENFYGKHSGREQNASYDSKFNAGQQLDDIFSGERGKYDAFRGGRGVKGTAKDLGVSFLAGTARMGTGLAQGAITLLGGNGPAVDRFFNAVNEGLENFQNSALSNEALARNARIDRNRARNVEAFDFRKNEYLKKGFSEGEAKFYAGAEEFQDTVADLLTEPGYILDKTVESLPYMIGVAAAGRAAVTSASRTLAKRTVDQVKKSGGSAEQAQASAQRFLQSEQGKKLLGRVATNTGVGTVGITEALSTSTDVYNSVLNMPEEEALRSDQYRALRAEGMEHLEATRALAEAAFESTFVPGLLIAGAASLITGAAGWESRLFTRRAGESAVSRASAKGAQEATESATGGLAARAVTGTARNVGRFARFAGPASISEATEEGIQSGSQEFLTQLANFNAGLGPEPGPGVGAAAGEGATIGAASGAGGQVVSGGVKKLADTDLRASGLQTLEKAREIRTLTDNTGTPGGSKAKAQRQNQNVAPAKAASDLDKLAEAWEKSDGNTLEDLAKRKADLDILMERASATEGGVSPAAQKMYDSLRGDYLTALDKAAKTVLDRNKRPDQRSSKEKEILHEAMLEDAPSVREDESLGRVYEHTRSSVDAINKQTEETISATAEAVEAGVEKKSSLAVAREKMGRAETKFGPGLMGHFERISEAITKNDTAAVESRFEKFNNFMQSQRRKLARLEAFLSATPEQQEANKEFSYKKNVTEKYYDTLFNELETMNKVHADLSALYSEWTSENKRKAKIPAAPATPKKRNWKSAPAEKADTKTESATQPEKKAGKRNWKKGKANEESTEQGSAKDNVGQSSSNAESGAATASDQKADSEGGTKSDTATRAAKSAPVQSKGSESSDAESSTATVGSIQRNINRLEAEIAAIDQRMQLPSAALKKQADERGMKLTEYRKLMQDNQRSRKAKLAQLKEQLKTAPQENTQNITFTDEAIEAEVVELEALSMVELKALARANNLEGYSALSKQDLINKIRNETMDEASRAEAEASVTEPTTPDLDIVEASERIEAITKILDNAARVKTEAERAGVGITEMRRRLRRERALLIRDYAPDFGQTQANAQAEIEATEKPVEESGTTEAETPVAEDTPLQKLRGKAQRFTFKNAKGEDTVAVAEWTQGGQRWVIARPVGKKTGWTVYHAETGGTSSSFGTNGTIDEAYNTAQRFLAKFSNAEHAEIVRKFKEKSAAPKSAATSRTAEEPKPLETPEDNQERISQAIFDEKNFVNALTRIQAFSKNELFAALAERLLEVLEGRDIKILVFNDKEFDAYMQKHGDRDLAKNPPSAAFLGDRQEIVLRQKYRRHPNTEQAFLHELTHAAINGWMTKPKSTSTEKALHERAYKLRTQILTALKELVQKNPDDTRYAEVLARLEENKEEWITYAWSNHQTQEVLKEIPIGATTAMKGILRLIQRILGLKGSTALDHTLAVSDQIFQRNVGERGRSAREGERFVPSAPPPTQSEIEAAIAQAEAEVEADVGVQAEAQPERSTETAAETEATSVEENDALWDSYNEVRRLQTLLRNGDITEDQVRFPGSMREDQRTLEALLRAGNTAVSALAQMETLFEEQLNKDIPRTEIPTDYLNMEAALAAAKELGKSGQTSSVGNTVEGASDFTAQSNWERIRKWILGSYDRANIVDIIKAAFTSRQIPTSIAAGFDTARETARSLITAVPNLHEILNNPKGRRELYNALNLTPEEEAAFDTFAAFRVEMEEAIQNAFQELGRDRIDFKDGNRIAQNPAYLLTDETDRLLPAVVTAIAYESMNWIAGDGSRMSNDDETIARILGLPDGATPTAAQSRLRTAGTLRRNVVDSLGPAIWRHMNLRAKRSPDIAPNLEERMESALGTIAIRALQITKPSSQRFRGRVQAISFDGSEFRAMKGDEATEHEDYSKPVTFIRSTALSDRGMRRFEMSDANWNLQQGIRPGRTVFNRIFGVSNVIKEPLTEAPTDEHVPTRALRSVTRLSKKMQEAIKFQQSRKWKAHVPLIDKLRQFNREQYLKLAHEYETDLDSVHDLNADNIQGRNRTLLTAFENALEWATRRGDGTMYFTYSMTRTGRTVIDSTYINPQQSKLHRFAFVQEEWAETINPGDNELLENFKIAVAQGMGLKVNGKGVDKLTRDVILKNIEEYMDSDVVREALEQLATDGQTQIDLEYTNEDGVTVPTALGSLLSAEGTHTLAALMAWQDYLNADGGAFTTNLPVEVDGVTNGFAAGLLQTPPTDPEALERLKDLLRAVGVIFTEDEEKSFAEWLRDPSNKDNYQKAAQKTAEAISRMMPGGDLFSSLDSKIDRDRFLMVIGEEMNALMVSGFGPTEQDLRDPKVGRDFAKNPLMIVAYGASSRTVSKNLVENLWIGAHQQMADVNRMVQRPNESDADFQTRQADALLDVMNRYVDVMNTGKRAFYAQSKRPWTEKSVEQHFSREDLNYLIEKRLVTDLTGEPVTTIGGLARSFVFSDNKKNGDYFKRNFTQAMEAVYGRGIEIALGEMLDGIRDIRNTYTQVITMMNAIFAIEFQRRVDVEAAATGRVVGRARRRAIVERMHSEGLVPSIASAYSDPNNLSENLELTAWQHNLIEDQNVKIIHDDVDGVTRIHYGDGTREVLGDTNSTTNNLTARNPSTDVGVAGVVGTIHSLDGTNSADIFGAFDVLNMFDAWVMKLSDLSNVPNQGNNRFYNQHHDYDMGQELVRSMDRMMLLVTQGDGRLSPAQRRAAGNLLISEMKKHNQWTEDMEEAYLLDTTEDGVPIYDSEGLMSNLANQMRNLTQEVTAARQEIMSIVARTDQFANDGTAYEVPKARRDAPIPTLKETEKHARQTASAAKISTKAATLARNLDGGNFNEAFFNWLQEEQVRPSEALRVLTELVGNNAPEPVAQLLSQLSAVVHQYSDNAKVILLATLPEGTKGRYGNNQIALDPSQFGENDSPIETLLHEIVHSATHEALEDLEENNPDLLNQIHARALALHKKLRTRKNLNRQQQEFVEAINGQLQSANDKVIMTGEYLAYVQTSLATDEMDQFQLALGSSVDWLQTFQSMGQLLTRGNTRNIRLRSSKDKVNNKLFDEQEGQKLESQKLWDNYEAMEELDAGTDAGSAKEYRDFIKHVMEGVLIPGLAALTNDVLLKLGVEPDGTKNLGEVERGSEADILKVQAAGAKLTHNGGMSNQEVFAHELFHAVTGFTIESDTKVRAELRKIYEYAKDRLTWEDFMPAEEDIAGDRAAVEQAAKDRYDYIFGEVEFDSEGNPMVDQLQEFAAIGLSNKPMAIALSRIDAPSAAEPLWEGNILSFLVNLVERGLEMLRGYTLGTRRAQNSADALFKLAQTIVTINKKAQIRKYDQKRHMGMWRNSVDTRAAEFITNKLDAAQRKLRLSEEEKKSKGTVGKWIRMGTHAALTQRTDAQQKANAEFMRHLGVNKMNDLAQVITEVLPYNKDDRGGADGKMGFLDLLRHSKVVVDIARQRTIEHTSSVLLGAFDRKRTMTRAQRLAMTNVVLRTDLHALMQHNETRTVRDIQQMLKNPALVKAEIARLERELGQELQKQNASKVLPMYQRQIESLATYMTRGVMTEDNGMKNAHNIVRQYNLNLVEDRVPLSDPTALDPIVDQLATLRAIQLTTPTDLEKALQVIDHEMDRTDDNGFFYLLGMAGNYKSASLNDLFQNNPVQMRKGYVYDITDGDRNIEVIFDTPSERKRMEDLGMIRIGRVDEDRHDRSAAYPRAMYKGFRGAAMWQKATVSLTSTQRQGTSLFEVSGFDPKKTRWNLGRMKSLKHQEALKQFSPGQLKNVKSIAIPVLDDRGVIVDYTYEMSLAARQQHLKNTRNNDYFDQVVPRMFGAIPDRVNSKQVNSQAAQLMFDEYQAFKDSPEHRFAEIGKYSDRRGKDMWNVIPDDMKRELAEKFRGTRFVDNKGRLIAVPIRDEAVNLVMGFRKLSILDLEVNGKKVIRGRKLTFAARTAEKVWQEIMQLVRIKMAIINPTVVVGNISSNFGILLAEGIPAGYIQKMTSEAIRSMRRYQRDVRKVDELQREIGVRRAHNQPTQKLVTERQRLIAEMRHNPVQHLVQEGLFTSIVEQSDSNEDTYREWVVSSALDKLTGPLPRKAVQLAKEAYMVPGSNAFNMAIAATQYGDFIGRYIKYKYDTEVKKVNEKDAINAALATFIYYDMPQNRWLQFLNDNGFMMFTKFFLRIQPVIARLFQENPVKATGVLALQSALMNPFDENIGKYALFNGLDNRYQPFPLAHVEKLDLTHPSLFQWFGFLGL